MELTVDQALQKGVAAHKEGKLQDAERLYRAILEAQPNHPDANHNLGVLAVAVGKPIEAIPLFNLALEANPRIEQFWLSYIDALIKIDKVNVARRVLADAHQAGVAAGKLRAFEEQLGFEFSASSHMPESEINGPLPSPQGELSTAIDLRESGRYEEAQEWLNKFVQNNPPNPEALSLLSQVLLLDKKEVEAEKMLEAAASIEPEVPSVYRNQARLLLKQSKPVEALEKAQLGCQQAQDDPESLLVLAACLGANQRDLEALPLIEKILKAKSNYAEAYANRALISLRAKDLTGATEDAKMVVSLKPHWTQMWQLLSSLHYQANNLSDAIDALRSAHENEPENPDFMVQLGELLRQDNKAIEAIIILEQATELAPKDANAWTNLGVALQQGGKIADAKRAYEEALVLSPESAAISSNLGTMAKEAKEWETALRYFEKALEIEPNFAEAHSNLGGTLQGLGRLDEAEASYRQAIALKPDLAEAHSNLGASLQDLARLDEAETSFRQAIAMKPDYAEAHSNLAGALKELGRWDEAEASYRQAIAFEPKPAIIHYKLGVLFFESRRYDQAIKHFELSDTPLSKLYAIKCSYLQDEPSVFNEKYDLLVSQGEINAVIGSLGIQSEFKYGTKKANPFCNEPLKYVVRTDLRSQYQFEKIFVQTARGVLANSSVSYRAQGHLANGVQTAGNIFVQGDVPKTEIENIIRAEIEKYRIKFKNSGEGFIKNWPTVYDIRGWLICMQSGGKLYPHMHDHGWISGSVYINVPPKSKADSGNLVLCLSDEGHLQSTEESHQSSVDVVTGALCLFPSSLHHYTIPFDEKEERIVLAFDVVPKEIPSNSATQILE